MPHASSCTFPLLSQYQYQTGKNGNFNRVRKLLSTPRRCCGYDHKSNEKKPDVIRCIPYSIERMAFHLQNKRPSQQRHWQTCTYNFHTNSYPRIVHTTVQQVPYIQHTVRPSTASHLQLKVIKL